MPEVRAARIAAFATDADDEESAAKMPPVCSHRDPLVRKDGLPVEVIWLTVRDGRISPVRATHSSAHPETTLRKIQPVAYRSPNPVIRNPAHKRRIDSSLEQ